MATRTAMAFVAALGALSGCILFVNDDGSSLGSACKFQGSDTACGKCVATSCAAPLDKCCGDKACEPQLTWLDACVSQSDSISCEVLASSAPDLAACLVSRCAACPGSDGGVAGGADGAGSPLCSAYAGYCLCTAGSSSGGGTCTAQEVAPGLCCADAGYPAAGTSCTCQSFWCTTTSGGADCGLSDSPTGMSSYSGGTCCANGSFCYCDDAIDSCNASETPVGACTVDAITCAGGTTSVTSCSF